MAGKKGGNVIVKKENLKLLKTPVVQRWIKMNKQSSEAVIEQILKDLRVNWEKEKDKRFSI